MMSATVSLRQHPSPTIKDTIQASLMTDGIAILPPFDVEESLTLMNDLHLYPTVTMLDPWYNKGFGGIRDDYTEYVSRLLDGAAQISEHVFLWGFPEIVARFVDNLPKPLVLVSW